MLPTPANTDAIIFDYGGVIINIDYLLTVKAFHELGAKNFEAQYSQAMQTGMFTNLETGRIAPDVFRQEIRLLLNKHYADEAIDRAWNALLLDMPEKRIRLLERLKSRYRIFLLSNSNIIHYKLYRSQLEEQYGYADFDALFNKAYFSFQTGLRKPEETFYELLLQEQKLIPERCLFIDDSSQNIAPAEALGIRCHWLQAGEDVSSLLQAY